MVGSGFRILITAVRVDRVMACPVHRNNIFMIAARPLVGMFLQRVVDQRCLPPASANAKAICD